MPDAEQMTPSENLPQLSRCSTPTTARCDRLVPASKKEGTAELLACLTLVAPTGMTAEDRQAWVAVARETLSGIPADLLREGCAYVRQHCRFPSEIVPTIMDRVGQRWEWRQWDARPRGEVRALPAPQPKPEYVDPRELQKLIRSIGR